MLKVIFIAGSGRSGSTLLDIAIGQHEKCFSTGELRQLWQYSMPENKPCGCGRRFDSCPFWKSTMRNFEASVGDLDPERVLTLRHKSVLTRMLPMVLRSRLGRIYKSSLRYGKIMSELYKAVADTSGAEVIVDSSKTAADLSCLMNTDAVDLFIIHLIRDSRGVVYSWNKKKYFAPTRTEDDMIMHQYGAWKATRRWLTINGQIEMITRDHDHFLRIRYEDFIREPKMVLENIYRTVQLEPEDSFLRDHTLEVRTNHLVGGNPVRFTNGFIKLEVDEAWQCHMDASTRRAVTAITWPLLKKYGYL